MQIEIVKREKYRMAVDLMKNRIYYTMFGFWQSPADVPNLLQDWEKTLTKVSQGFTVLADLTQSKPAGQSVMPLFEQVQSMLITAGLKKSAELFGESAIVILGAGRLAKHSGIYRQSFTDRGKAEAWLDA